MTTNPHRCRCIEIRQVTSNITNFNSAGARLIDARAEASGTIARALLHIANLVAAGIQEMPEPVITALATTQTEFDGARTQADGRLQRFCTEDTSHHLFGITDRW